MDYQPKHLKKYDSDYSGHCCFAGCTPMGCPGNCCVNMGWHRASCPLNSMRQFDEADHEIYIHNGLPKHFAKTSSDEPCDVCNGTGLTYDSTECRMVPCGGICCKVKP